MMPVSARDSWEAKEVPTRSKAAFPSAMRASTDGAIAGEGGQRRAFAAQTKPIGQDGHAIRVAGKDDAGSMR